MGRALVLAAGASAPRENGRAAVVGRAVWMVPCCELLEVMWGNVDEYCNVCVFLHVPGHAVGFVDVVVHLCVRVCVWRNALCIVLHLSSGI